MTPVRLKFAVLALALVAFMARPAGSGSDNFIESIQSGNWSNASTWNTGSVPQAGDDVRINRGHTVVYDRSSSNVLHSVLANGRLEFARDRNTLMEVGLLVTSNNENFDINSNSCQEHAGHHTQGGPVDSEAAIVIGSPNNPIPENVTATIRLAYFDDHDPSCAPGIISHGGRMDFHGAPIDKTWVKLGATMQPGANTVTLAEPVDWKAGDQIIVTASEKDPTASRNSSLSFLKGDMVPQTEKFTINKISNGGRTLTLSGTLQFKHFGGFNASDLRSEVGLLSRNVVIESRDPDGVRGHTMYHTGGPGSISYAEFRHLGKEQTLGRYPIHFHLTKDARRGAYVKGVSVWDSANRWITIHGTEYMVVRDSVAYQSVGHGIFFEDGSEVYNLIENNLLVQSYQTDSIAGQAIDYDRNAGAAIWTANARNSFINNVIVEPDNMDSLVWDYRPDREPQFAQALQPDGSIIDGTVLMPDGSRQQVAINEIAGGRVRGNELHTHWGWGPWIKWANYKADEPLVVKDTKVWEVHYSFDISGDNVIFDGVENYNSEYGFYNLYPGPHIVRNAYAEDVDPHGAYMTYRGGSGPQFYENITTKSSELVWRMTAKNEVGSSGQPIIIHARNYKVLDPDHVETHWFGMEDDTVRSDPLTMLVLHEKNGVGRDIFAMPENQSASLAGVPPGLTFTNVDADTTVDEDGVGYEGRGESKIAEGNIEWPDHPLFHPVDRVPPASVILSPQPFETVASAGIVIVKGVSVDENNLTSVTVNGVSATIASNGIDWTATLTGVANGSLTITAVGTDDSGNRELTPHTVAVTVGSGPRPNPVPWLDLLLLDKR